MTFSSASLSDCGVDDVVATAAGVTCLRGGGRAACWRVAGAKEGVAEGATAEAAGAAASGVGAAAAAVFVVAGCLGPTLRAIGRGFGRGTLGLAQASTESADRPKVSPKVSPKASARLVG